jgi:hypothetical protein
VDSPIGHGLSPFVLDYLVHEGHAAALLEPAAALAALRGFDPSLASGFSALLNEPASVDGLKLTMEDFDEASDAGETPVTSANLVEAVRLGCMRRLFSGRHDAFVALRRGFVRCEDLSVQCAALGSAAALSLLLQGKRTLTTAEVRRARGEKRTYSLIDGRVHVRLHYVLPRRAVLTCTRVRDLDWQLLDCFLLDDDDEAGFASAGADHVPTIFVELLQDASVFDEPRRFAMLRWCTALHALPVGGLKDEKIKLRLYGDEPDDESLPECHTCTRELHLPRYTSAGVLREKLLLALDHEDDGFGKA